MSENENENASEPPSLDGNKLVPADTSDDGRESSSDGQRGEELRFPSRQEILTKLDHMLGLVAMGLLPPPRANTMRGICQTMLMNLPESSSPAGAAAIADEDLVAVLRTKPELLKMLKPFLTQGQLDLIVREAAND